MRSLILSFGALVIGWMISMTEASWTPDVISYELIKKVPDVNPHMMAYKLDEMLEKRRNFFGSCVFKRGEKNILETLIAMRDNQNSCGIAGYQAFSSVHGMLNRFTKKSKHSSNPHLYGPDGPIPRLYQHMRKENYLLCIGEWRAQYYAALASKDTKEMNQLDEMFRHLFESMRNLEREPPSTIRNDLRKLKWLDQITKREVKALLRGIRKLPKSTLDNDRMQPRRYYDKTDARDIGLWIIGEFVLNSCRDYRSGFQLAIQQINLRPDNQPKDKNLDERFDIITETYAVCSNFLEEGLRLAKYMSFELLDELLVRNLDLE